MLLHISDEGHEVKVLKVQMNDYDINYDVFTYMYYFF